MRRLCAFRPSVRSVLACAFLLLLLACTACALIWPEASGTSVQKSSSLQVDYSHAEDGYIMAKATASGKKYKLRIKFGDTTSDYNLNSEGEYEVFPLQMGSGSYSLSLYICVSGKKYTAAGSLTLNCTVSSETAPFLCPSQYVPYTPETEAVALSNTLCASLTADEEKFQAIRDYIKKNYRYDFLRALSVTPGQMPDVDYCTSQKMGICQDLAATAACMLRVQGIPTRLVIGYANGQYHAWNAVYLNGQYVTYDPTVDVGGISGKVQYTVERYY